jgi:[ribosomal protein S5]-alanine N-acetyltransferase
MLPFLPLTTPRLLLRPLAEPDAPALYTACSNPNLTAFTLFETHTTPEVSANFIKTYALPNYAVATPDPLAITLNNALNGELIGCCGGRWTEIRCNNSIEVGYWIAEPHWGHGYATEALRALVPYLFATLSPRRIQAHCMTTNRPSARVLQKAGFQFEGTLRQAIFRRGTYTDIDLYAVIAPDS